MLHATMNYHCQVCQFFSMLSKGCHLENCHSVLSSGCIASLLTPTQDSLCSQRETFNKSDVALTLASNLSKIGSLVGAAEYFKIMARLYAFKPCINMYEIYWLDGPAQSDKFFKLSDFYVDIKFIELGQMLT